MKVSDPIIFGHAVRTFFADVFAEHGDALARGRREPEPRPGQHPDRDRAARRRTSARRSRRRSTATYESAPRLAMVDSDRGITNLHVPSDVIVDASMPAMIRTSGQMWNADGEQQDAKAVIPDSSYAALYAETIAFCREHGAFDPATMGTTPNVGLMAQKAEEYGSHDKTFEIERRRRRARGRRRRRRRCSSTTSRPATCGAAARPRTRRWPTGSGSRSSARGRPARRRSSGSTRRAPHDAEVLEKVERELRRARHRRAARSRSCRSPRRPASRSSGPRAARTRSRSPATSCATTSPTCSRSSSSARARRCSRSSR